MNKRGEFNVQGMIIAILTAGLFIAVMATWISETDYYDSTGFSQEKLDQFNKVQNLTSTLQQVAEDVDSVSVDSSWFDFFSGIFEKLLRPFKFVYRTFAHLINMADQATSIFKLMPVFREYFTALVLTLVIVGIVLWKMHLGKQK